MISVRSKGRRNATLSIFAKNSCLIIEQKTFIKEDSIMKKLGNLMGATIILTMASWIVYGISYCIGHGVGKLIAPMVVDLIRKAAR